MKTNPKVLFVIGGFGLGNSTRCDAVIQELAIRGFHIDVATSNNGLWYFSSSPAVKRLFPLRALSYGRRNGQISLIGTLLAVPVSLFSLLLNACRLWRLQRGSVYQWIAVDSEYSCFLIKWILSARLVAINNVFFTFQCRNTKGPRLTIGLLLHRAFESFDFAVQSFFSDYRIAPALCWEQARQDSGTLFCPNFVRFLAPGAHSKVKRLNHALVVASGSGLGVSRDTIEQLVRSERIAKISVVGLEGTSTGKVHYFGRCRTVQSMYDNADFVVGNAGFSTISEAIANNRLMLVYPLHNHYEQYFNAEFVEAAGLGVVVRSDGLTEGLIGLEGILEKKLAERPKVEKSSINGTVAAADFLSAISNAAAVSA